MNIDIWLIFLGGVLLSAILPGAGAIITLNHAFQYGWHKTLPLIAGQATALALMVPMVACIAEVFRTSEPTWLLLKCISIIWLLFAAYKTWRAPIVLDSYDAVRHTSNVQSFLWGFFTDITNAKAFIFLLATLPIFLNPDNPPELQITIMTLTMVMVDALIMILYAMIAARLRPYFQSLERRKQQNRVLAAFLIVIAASLYFIEPTTLMK